MTETITQSFVLTPDDAKIIDNKAKSMGNSSNSSALRAILREWLETQRVSLTEAGRKALEDCKEG